MEQATNLTGSLLIAMPSMDDNRFQKSVILMCEHGPQGAMGIVINKPFENVDFSTVLEQVELSPDDVEEDAENLAHDDFAFEAIDIQVQRGGPVETGRGFVLHSRDYEVDGSTMVITDDIAMTATLDILKALALGKGPEQALLALGYAGWSGGQLEEEIQANGWLHVPSLSEIVFSEDLDSKYNAALASIGISPMMLSSERGHA